LKSTFSSWSQKIYIEAGLQGWRERRLLSLINKSVVSEGTFDNTLHKRVKIHSQTYRVLLGNHPWELYLAVLVIFLQDNIGHQI
jgi:hypothetical protein